MENLISQGFLEQGILGVIALTFLFLLIHVYRSKEKQEIFFRERDREELSVMKDLTNIVNVMNNTLTSAPNNIKDKLESSIRQHLSEISAKLDLIMVKYEKNGR